LNAIVRRRHVLSEGAASDGDERVLAVLSMMIGLFEAFRVIFPFFSPEIHRKCLSCLSVGIASFIDRLEDCISTDSAFANLVMSSSHPNLRCLLRLYDEVCAEASQLFHLLISSADNAKETSVMKLQEVLVYER
uniref:Anticodon_1 domain-containing protein n=1 Tax=Anisakis simplex TaxID=6269 RepID=A0A0M3J6E2_ANISI